MEKTDFHLMVCNSFRLAQGDAKGVCHRKGAVDLLRYLESEVSDRGLSASINVTGCFNICEKGPAMLVFPEGNYYGHLDEGRIDEVLDGLEEGGEGPEELRLT